MTRLSSPGGCEIKVRADLMESSNRRGREKVLVDGSQWLGAIMKKPWLHTAFSKLNLGNLSKLIVNFQDGSVNVVIYFYNQKCGHNL
uniref:Putative ovule protein n=1 Tax=Solanum chacoense TaxID=4108 RepID=A0A0V0H648_SOLCH